MTFRRQFPGLGIGPWKTYDVVENPEWKLAESVALEFCDIAGINCTYYLQNLDIEPDTLYGETQNKEYLEGKNTKVVYEVGEIQTTYSMFGMIAQDQLVIHIPQATYRRDISQTIPPKPGDAIVIPFYRDAPFMEQTREGINPDYDGLCGRAFEIIHVAEDQNIFQLRSVVYSLYCIPYRYSEESDSARNISMDIDDLYDPHCAYQRFPETETPSITAFGDNDWIEDKSEEIDEYQDVDRSIYGK